MIPEPDFTGYTIVRDSCLFINYLATAKVQKFLCSSKRKMYFSSKIYRSWKDSLQNN
nr:MAG TPA: hypothetical protein [Caudoviricetes sp.]